MNTFSNEFFIAFVSMVGGINIFLTVWFIRISERKILDRIQLKQTQIDNLSKRLAEMNNRCDKISGNLLLTQNRLDATFKAIGPKHLNIPKFRGE